MKKPDLSKLSDRVIELKQKAIDIVLDELVEPLKIVGNPETLIGKPYEVWNQQDLNSLAQIYGQGDETPLARLIFTKEYEKVKELENA